MEQELIGKGKDNGAAAAMTLAYIAFCKNIPKALEEYMPQWKPVWLAEESVGGNLAYIAYNGAQYVIAIRGSVLSFSMAAFDTWFREDFNLLLQVHWKYPEIKTGAMISEGSNIGLHNLKKLKNKDGETIWDYLQKNALSNDASICVTGHSLGGALSSVFSLWLRYKMTEANLPVPSFFPVLTFAAPTAGNKSFARLYDEMFPDSYRYYNVIDLVPHSANMILQMNSLFPKPGVSAKDAGLHDVVDVLAVLVHESERLFDSYYSHTNRYRGSIPLNTEEEIFPVTSKQTTEAWFEQVGWQHDQASYLKFLGAKPMNCAE